MDFYEPKIQNTEVKFTLQQTTKTQRWSSGVALLFLQPRSQMGVVGQFIPSNETRYPLYRSLGGPQSLPGRVQ